MNPKKHLFILFVSAQRNSMLYSPVQVSLDTNPSKINLYFLCHHNTLEAVYAKHHNITIVYSFIKRLSIFCCVAMSWFKNSFNKLFQVQKGQVADVGRRLFAAKKGCELPMPCFTLMYQVICV